ncbi:MAG: hypothetical protein OJF49_001892 [Ktedonobacterales bacterium]|jgi:hypothetical protein|nr:MAG: hypothetical protein OJF49_001892 [Ktedonobacterales bacterium]
MGGDARYMKRQHERGQEKGTAVLAETRIMESGRRMRVCS